MPYSYRDYEKELASDLAQFSEIIKSQIGSKEFNRLSPEQKADCIWKIFESFSREYSVPSWAKCLQLKWRHECRWRSDVSDIFSGKSRKDILVVFEELVRAHKLPACALCFERANNQFFHDAYFRCKRCDNSTAAKKI